MTRTRFAPLAALLLAALLLAGCGGGGGGEPTVTQTIHDELQAELDAVLAARRQAETARAAAETAKAEAETARVTADEMRTAAETARATAESERDTARAAETAARAAQAEAEAARAEAEADEADALAKKLAAEALLATAQKDLEAVEAKRNEYLEDRTAARTALTEANAKVAELTRRVEGLEGDLEDANAEDTRLTGLLTTANAEVTRLEGVIGAATDAANAAENASLHAQLKAAKAEASRLTGELTTAQGKVTALETRVGTEDDASSLQGMLAAEKAKVKTLTDDLEEATAKVAELAEEIGDVTTPNSLKARLATALARVTDLENRLSNADDQVRRLTQDLATARGERDTARDRADQADTRAREATQQAQGLEANQRAEGLLSVFPTFADPPIAPSGDSPVDMSVPSPDTLTFKQDGRSVRTFSASGLQGARLTRTRGGTDTTVVYTDRELRRPLLDHYGEYKHATIPQFDVAMATVLANGADAIAASGVSVSHGLDSSLGASQYTAGGNKVQSDADTATLTGRVLTKEENFFSGSVHRVPGRFYCEGDAACGVTATGTYHDNDADATTLNENKLNTVVLSVESDETLHFRPSSATAETKLCEDSTKCTAGDDGQYMTFGWWRHDPASVNGTYRFGVFSDVMGTGITSISGVASTVVGTAEYDGTAVGMYVDQDALAKRQGEFTANVRLTADFGGDTLSGEIDSFDTAPTGGSAAPVMSDSWFVVLADGGSATIRRRGSASAGAWVYEFVPNHSNLPDTTQPLSVTGAFDTRIENLLRIVGAFGAER